MDSYCTWLTGGRWLARFAPDSPDTAASAGTEHTSAPRWKAVFVEEKHDDASTDRDENCDDDDNLRRQLCNDRRKTEARD